MPGHRRDCRGSLLHRRFGPTPCGSTARPAMPARASRAPATARIFCTSPSENCSLVVSAWPSPLPVGHIDVAAVIGPLGGRDPLAGAAATSPAEHKRGAFSHLSHVQAVSADREVGSWFLADPWFAPARHRHRLGLRQGAPADETSAQWFGRRGVQLGERRRSRTRIYLT